jgi:hypothetical protein
MKDKYRARRAFVLYYGGRPRRTSKRRRRFSAETSIVYLHFVKPQQ